MRNLPMDKELFDQMWSAVLKKCDELSSITDIGGGSSRSPAYISSGGNAVQTTLDITRPDGSHIVYIVEAVLTFVANDFEVKYKTYYHNNEDYWNEILVHDKERGNAVIVNSTHYTLGDENTRGSVSSRGFGGAKYVIRFHDGREVVSTNLWYQGPIPPALHYMFPDNAEFVNK